MPAPATILTASAVFLTAALLRGISGDGMIVAPGVTVEFTCTGPADQFQFEPTWFVNGRVAVTEGDCYRSTLRRSGELNYTSTLVIIGNHTCDTFNVYCRIYSNLRFLYLHNTTLIVHDHLPSPENIIHINESVTIEWRPPYFSLNNGTIQVDPHITQYTVYITDNYTGNIIAKENVTDTHFTFNSSDDGTCPMYQVSAWNSGGEGELSDPVWDSTPQVPHRIAVEHITVNVLRIYFDVDVVCTSRIPEFFLITLVDSTGSGLNMTHDPGQPVANFTISLPPSMDVCSLHVRVSAGNSARMSAPSEAVEVDCPDSSTDYTAATSTGGKDNPPPEDLTVLKVVAVAGGVIIAVLTVGIFYKMYRKHRRRNSKGQRATSYSESPSLGGPALYKLPVTEVVYATTEQTTSRPVAGDPEHTAISMQTLDSTPSTLRTDSSAESGRSTDLLLQPNPRAPVGSPHLVYAQFDPVKQTEVHPPAASDDPVQYAQIEH